MHFCFALEELNNHHDTAEFTEKAPFHPLCHHTIYYFKSVGSHFQVVKLGNFTLA